MRGGLRLFDREANAGFATECTRCIGMTGQDCRFNLESRKTGKETKSLSIQVSFLIIHPPYFSTLGLLLQPMGFHGR
jgi:hypothetical protein